MIKNLLVVSALAEAPVGAALVLSPEPVARLLLGATLDAPAAVIVARIAGAALSAIGVGCWLARGDGRGARAIVTAMLVYNGASVAVLAHAGAVIGLAGVLLWPAVGLHVALFMWCIAGAAAARK